MYWLRLLEDPATFPFSLDISGAKIFHLLKPELKRLLRRCDEQIMPEQVEKIREIGLFDLLTKIGENQKPLFSPIVYALLVRFLANRRVDIAQLVAGVNLTYKLTGLSGTAIESVPYLYQFCQSNENINPLPAECLRQFAGQITRQDSEGRMGIFLFRPFRVDDAAITNTTQISGHQLDIAAESYIFRVDHKSDLKFRCIETLSVMSIVLGQMDQAISLMETFITKRVIFNRRMIEFKQIRTRFMQSIVNIAKLEALLGWICQAYYGFLSPHDLEMSIMAFSSLVVSCIGEIIHTFGGNGLMRDSGIPRIYETILYFLESVSPLTINPKLFHETLKKNQSFSKKYEQTSLDLDPEGSSRLRLLGNLFRSARNSLSSQLESSEANIRREATHALFQFFSVAVLLLISKNSLLFKNANLTEKIEHLSIVQLGRTLRHSLFDCIYGVDLNVNEMIRS